MQTKLIEVIPGFGQSSRMLKRYAMLAIVFSYISFPHVSSGQAPGVVPPVDIMRISIVQPGGDPEGIMTTPHGIFGPGNEYYAFRDFASAANSKGYYQRVALPSEIKYVRNSTGDRESDEARLEHVLSAIYNTRNGGLLSYGQHNIERNHITAEYWRTKSGTERCEDTTVCTGTEEHSDGCCPSECSADMYSGDAYDSDCICSSILNGPRCCIKEPV